MKEPALSTAAVTLPITTEAASASSDRTAEAARCILFFDGVCGLCSWSVDFVMVRDRRELFQFAPLQGDTARQLLTASFARDLDSVVLLVEGQPFRKSAAAIRVLCRLGFGWQLLGTLAWLIPLPLRDLVYDLVARNRYRLFGKHETCRMPTPAERSRFLP